MKCEISIAGFGGQGVLFLGKLIAFAGMEAGYEVSWMPSYGPEMRGGTANCAVIISDDAIGSPFVDEPNVLVAMNKPSYLKFEPTVTPEGFVVVDSSLVKVSTERTDIELLSIPATEIAVENEIRRSANLILAGRVFKKLGFIPDDAIERAVRKCSPEGKPAIYEANMKAINL